MGTVDSQFLTSTITLLLIIPFNFHVRIKSYINVFVGDGKVAQVFRISCCFFEV